MLFSERCAGCHTMYAAGTHGSAPNIRTAAAISGPNFNVRCERPIDRVLYAIANGGFSGAYMPQNIVVGQDAVDVAKFVSTYAGAYAPKQIGLVNCNRRSVGTLPPGSGQATVASATTDDARRQCDDDDARRECDDDDPRRECDDHEPPPAVRVRRRPPRSRPG